MNDGHDKPRVRENQEIAESSLDRAERSERDAKLSPSAKNAIQGHELSNDEQSVDDAIKSRLHDTSGLYMRRGKAAEIAAVHEIGGDAVELDAALENDRKTSTDENYRGFSANKFPTYDISSSTEIASVKTHFNNDGSFTDSHIKSYVGDFNKMLGFDRSYDGGLSPLEQDAANLVRLRDLSLPVPKVIDGMSEDEVAGHLEKSSVLRIPDNQIEAVTDRLPRRHRPRVKGVGKTTYELAELL